MTLLTLRRLALFPVILIVLGMAPSTSQAAILYALTGGPTGGIYTVDTDTQVSTLVMSLPNQAAIARGPCDVLYVSDGATIFRYEIIDETLTPVTPINSDGLALGEFRNGSLFHGSGNELHQLEPGVSGDAVAGSSPGAFVGDMVGVGPDLFGFRTNSAGTQRFVQIDHNTGIKTNLTTQTTIDWTGLAFAEGQLWASASGGTTTNDLYTIDLGTNTISAPLFQSGLEIIDMASDLSEIRAEDQECCRDGDVNGIGGVTVSDFSELLSCTFSSPEPLITEACASADLNGNGFVDNDDIVNWECQFDAQPLSNPNCCRCSGVENLTNSKSTFSISFRGATPILQPPPAFGFSFANDGAQILTSAGGSGPGPNPDPGTDTFDSPGISLGQADLGLNSLPQIEIDALSFGRDIGLSCSHLDSQLQFSVDEHAVGFNSAEKMTHFFAGAEPDRAESAAGDIYTYNGLISANTSQTLEGATPTIDARWLGLFEPYTPFFADGDNLDAFDGDTRTSHLSGPVYFSLDGPTGMDPLDPTTTGNGANLHLFSGGDVLIFDNALPTVAIPSVDLGLDFFGFNTDDLDALAFDDADGSKDYSPGDTLLFSVRRGSLVISQLDSALGLPIEPGDVLRPPLSSGNFPAIHIPAENIGLLTSRTDGVSEGDELDALDSRFVPEPAFGLSIGLGLAWIIAGARSRRAGRH